MNNYGYVPKDSIQGLAQQQPPQGGMPGPGYGGGMPAPGMGGGMPAPGGMMTPPPPPGPPPGGPPSMTPAYPVGQRPMAYRPPIRPMGAVGGNVAAIIAQLRNRG